MTFCLEEIIILDTYTPLGYMSSMYTPTKNACLKRLARIEGQIRGLARMLEEDRYCIDVITQIGAVRAALNRVEDEILRDHVAHCVEEAITSGNQAGQRRKITELMQVLGRANR
jgi:DNA-binding FrmR family transcriptional regulator